MRSVYWAAALAALVACGKPKDADGDGVDRTTDCNDEDPAAHPGATETCNGVDDNCDGVVDEPEAVGLYPWFADADGDGHGAGAVVVESCVAPDGLAPDPHDCDDADATRHPEADEICDGIDQDCNGTVDDEPVDPPPWFLDVDGDGYGESAQVVNACEAPSGRVADGGDCDDANPDLHPTAIETCDGVDEDCDGWIDRTGAEDACMRTDVFEVRPPALDVLVVIDASASMVDEDGRFADAATSFLDGLRAVADVQIGVITAAEPTLVSVDGTRWLDDAMSRADAAAWLTEAVAVGLGGPGYQPALDTIMLAIGPGMPAENVGFLRATADLAVVVVSDDDDPSVATVEEFVAFYTGLDPGFRSTVSGIVPVGGTCLAGATAPRLLEVFDATGGTGVDVCDADWQPGLDLVATRSAPSSGDRFWLSEEPDQSSMWVTITVDGETTRLENTEWDYLVSQNAVELDDELPLGSTVIVQYRAEPRD